jgi:CubicO group peptidase (beta-lactamase class C family)
MSQPGAAGGLMSTGGDLVRWMMALSSGKVVKPESFALMTTPTVLPSGRDTHYGFGLSIDEFAGKKCISHGGGIFGFNSMIKWIPEADLCVAVISNGEPLSSGKIADAIANKLLGIERPVIKDEATTTEKARAAQWKVHVRGHADGRARVRGGRALEAASDRSGRDRTPVARRQRVSARTSTTTCASCSPTTRSRSRCTRTATWPTRSARLS